jgi:manganese efflux pump family protein
VLALFFVAASLGMSNLAASIAIGISGIDASTRLRVGLIFGVFEAGMPAAGLLIGAQVAASLGHAARFVGAGLLIAVGLYALASAARAGQGRQVRPPGVIHLLVAGLALSVDNLVVGFALGTTRISVAVSVIVIGTVSVAMSLLGLELGAGASRWSGQRGEQLAGLMLICVGIAIASGVLS